MALTITDRTGTTSIAREPHQRVLEVVDDADAAAATGTVKISVATERQASAVKYTLKGWLVDADGAYVEVAGEPVSLPASEHTWMLGQSDGEPAQALAKALEQEAARLWRAYRQLAAM